MRISPLFRANRVKNVSCSLKKRHNFYGILLIMNTNKTQKASLDTEALTKTIAILLSITPQTPLGKFLRLCLETKVDPDIAGQTPLETAQEFMADPNSLKDWAEELICADGEVQDQEWEALEGLEINSTEDFLVALWAELDRINL